MCKEFSRSKRRLELIVKIIGRLKLPETKYIRDLDDPATTLLHAKIVQNKPFLKKLYTDFYKQFQSRICDPQNRVLVELGSGGGFIKEVISNVITSDILELPSVDKAFSAFDMPFESDSVDVFLMFIFPGFIIMPLCAVSKTLSNKVFPKEMGTIFLCLLSFMGSCSSRRALSIYLQKRASLSAPKYFHPEMENHQS